jgi:hypothetical protein
MNNKLAEEGGRRLEETASEIEIVVEIMPLLVLIAPGQ